MSIITKSDFLKFKECSTFFWFWKNDQSVLSKEKEDPFIDRLKSQGYEVELFARSLYPEALLVTGIPEEAAKTTSLRIPEALTPSFRSV